MELNCEYFRNGCKEIVYYENFQEHVKECNYKYGEIINYMPCEFCNREYEVNDLINHLHVNGKKECFPNLAQEIKIKNESIWNS